MDKFTKCYLVVTEVRDGDERYNDTFVMETTDDLFKAEIRMPLMSSPL